jgi:L-threonylcarbamoyladenylate synthase
MKESELQAFVAQLRAGGVLACPTETLQGLLADALNPAAVARVVALKRRGDEPIALLVPNLAAVLGLIDGELSAAVQALAAAHWPGPLTLVFRARPGLPDPLAPAGTLGVRIPGASPALDLVRAFGGPLTATSCNISGQPAARTQAEALAYFAGQLDGSVPGDAPGGAPSTVVDATGPVLRVLRQGAVHVPGA